MMLKDLPLDARPREKLLARGSSALSDAELLALLLRTGIEGKNVVALAHDVLTHFSGLRGLLHADARALAGIKGLGPAKQAELMAVVELARRALAQELSQQAVLDSPATMKDFVRLQIGSKPHECFMVLFLDVKQRLIAFEEMFRGSLTSTSVYPREVVLRALQHQASAVVLAHNHPSGDVLPSQADIQLTSKLRAALALLDIRVLDHVIAGQDRVLSMAEQGLV